MELSRRNCLKGAALTLTAKEAIAKAPTATSPGRFYLAEVLGNPESRDVTIARQVGIKWVITNGGMARARKED
jgi:hypothetical protein